MKREDTDAATADGGPAVAVFRPDDERLATAVSLLRDLGVDPVADPMLAVEPTGSVPVGASYVVFTSRTGAERVAAEGWEPGESTVVAIGPKTAAALSRAGYAVDLVPEDFSSAGLVDLLGGRVDGETVELARSDHGSAVLPEGLREAGAEVTETTLYRLIRPEGAGESAELAAAGDLDAACFTSSLTVEHFLAAAEERGVRDAAVAGLADAVVGVIGPPTRETAEAEGLAVDAVPAEATFEALARETVAQLDR